MKEDNLPQNDDEDITDEAPHGFSAEVWDTIFAYLGVSDRASVAACCRFFRNAINIVTKRDVVVRLENLYWHLVVRHQLEKVTGGMFSTAQSIMLPKVFSLHATQLLACLRVPTPEKWQLISDILFFNINQLEMRLSQDQFKALLDEADELRVLALPNDLSKFRCSLIYLAGAIGNAAAVKLLLQPTRLNRESIVTWSCYPFDGDRYEQSQTICNLQDKPFGKIEMEILGECFAGITCDISRELVVQATKQFYPDNNEDNIFINHFHKVNKFKCFYQSLPHAARLGSLSSLCVYLDWIDSQYAEAQSKRNVIQLYQVAFCNACCHRNPLPMIREIFSRLDKLQVDKLQALSYYAERYGQSSKKQACVPALLHLSVFDVRPVFDYLVQTFFPKNVSWSDDFLEGTVEAISKCSAEFAAHVKMHYAAHLEVQVLKYE